MYYLVPVVIGVVRADGTADLSAGTGLDRGTDIAAGQEEIAVVAGLRRVLAGDGAKETTVGTTRLEPEGGGQAAFGQVERLKAAQ